MSDADRGVIGGRYQVIASLGKGGMGQVYKAYDPVLDRTVALKKMIATVVDSEEGRQRFYIEARAAARLNHPNIVTIHELEEYSGDIYIVMELLDGVSLAGFMRQRVDMPLAGYLTIIAQMGEGLHYAHKRAIVHRDVKPANLVLTTAGNLKILDFGIARLASSEITKKGKLLGTPNYMAPEQVMEQPVDARADLFSLGAVAYELVTGVKPFAADSIPALLMQITSTPHRPVLDVAPQTEPALAAIIDRLLSKDRTARFLTGMELVAALDLIGEIDRVDYVAEAVAAVMGPSGEATVYAPIGSTPIPTITPTPASPAPPMTPPEPPTAAASTLTPPTPTPPLFGVTPTVAPSVVVPRVTVPPLSVTPTPAAQTPPEDTLPADAPNPWLGHAAAASASSEAPTLVDVQASTKPDVPPPSVTLDTVIGAPPPLPKAPVAPIAADPPPPVAPPLVASPPIAPPPAVPPPVAMPPITTPPASAQGASSASTRAAAPIAPLPPSASAPIVPANVAANTPAASTARGFVSPGVPQARHRSGSGMAIVVIGLLLLPAVIAAGWWAFNSVRGSLRTGTTASDTASPSAVKDADPSTQKPAEPPAATTDPANQGNPANPADQAKPEETPKETPAETPSQEQPPQTPAVDANANASTSTPKPPESEPPARPTEATPTANANQTSQPNQAPAANQAIASQNPPPDASRAAPTNQANANQADANRPIEARDARNPQPPAREPVTDRSREISPETVVRDASRESSRTPGRDTTAPEARREPREPAPPVREEPAAVEPAREPAREPSTPADTRSLDYGSLNAFRGGSRSTGSASDVYSDSPSTAAAVARITYALEAYGEAIAARDLGALRDVRSPVTPAETAMLKEGRLTVRFSNLDVSINGSDARVRCQRAVVANGKTISSGPSDVRLTRRPEGWVITDIR